MTNTEPGAPTLRAVAAELGLLPEDTRCHTGDFAGGRIRFAGRAGESEPSDFLLLWKSGAGWELVAGDGPAGSMRVVAELPGTPPHAPRAVADFVLTALTERGERLVRRSDEPPDPEVVARGEKHQPTA